LDELAISRRAAGLPATSVNWGWWKSTAETPEVDEYFREVGLQPMAAHSALRGLERAIASGRPNLTIASVDWGRLREVYEASGRRTLLTEIPIGKASSDIGTPHQPVADSLRTATHDRVPALLSNHLRECASGSLGIAPSQIDENAPLSRLGLDSLMALSLKNRLVGVLGVDIPLSMFLKGASIGEIRSWLLPHFGVVYDAPKQNYLDSRDPWIVTTQPCPQAQIRLLCFSYAGGGPSVFREWSKPLAPEIEVCAVQLPGRAERCAEMPFDDLDALLSELVPAVVPYLDRPWAMFGHCLGAIVMFELYRRLPQHVRRPLRLFVSGAPAPRFYSVMDPSTISRDKFHDMLRVIGFAGTEALFQDDEAYRLLMPAVLGDFALAARYRHKPGASIDVPVSAYAAYEDIFAPPAVVEAWRETTSAPFGVTVYPGGHYFLEASRQDILSDVRRLALAEPQPASPHLTPLKPARKAGTILFCFHNAGGDGSSFQNWPAGLPDRLEVRPLELPGHGLRAGEPALVRVDQLAESLLHDLTGQIDRPFVFFGHDFGGLLSFEIARRLRRDGFPMPSRLLLSACFPPHMYYLPPLHLFPAEKLLEMLAIFDFRTSDSQPLTTEKLHSLRADFEAAATYQYRVEPPLAVPFEILIAAHDAFVPDSGPRQWEPHTTAGCSQHVYEGNHYSFMGSDSPILKVAGRLI
jgi:surfactin synthase thioesterase subunit/acyl carrier protein